MMMSASRKHTLNAQHLHTHTDTHTHTHTHTHPVITAWESSNLVQDYNLSGCLGPDSEKCLSKWHFNKMPSNTQKVQAHMQVHAHVGLLVAMLHTNRHTEAQTHNHI